MRKIHINNQVWTYVIGEKNVAIRSPKNKKVVVDFPTLKGISWEKIHEARDTYCTLCHEFCEFREKEGVDFIHGMIRPSDVKTYIEKNLI